MRSSTAESLDCSTRSESPFRSRRTSTTISRTQGVTSCWREVAMAWQRQHAPWTTYDRLVRASVAEVSSDERATIRKDISRSQPRFFARIAPGDLDVPAHEARLERVLCAWTQYDQEIGYVQAMNLVSATLLLLLDGDEEATFWVLVILLRQLPPQFYCRAPPQLLGFWAEVEVLSQLAARLLGLGGLRNALLQVAPQWMLEFWVGLLPLEMIVSIWDHVSDRTSRASPTLHTDGRAYPLHADPLAHRPFRACASVRGRARCLSIRRLRVRLYPFHLPAPRPRADAAQRQR